jgi:hypothetical protein
LKNYAVSLESFMSQFMKWMEKFLSLTGKLSLSSFQYDFNDCGFFSRVISLETQQDVFHNSQVAIHCSTIYHYKCWRVEKWIEKRGKFDNKIFISMDTTLLLSSSSFKRWNLCEKIRKFHLHWVLYLSIDLKTKRSRINFDRNWEIAKCQDRSTDNLNSIDFTTFHRNPIE